MNCSICFETVPRALVGAGCDRCSQVCCIICDVQTTHCPYCRHNVSWRYRFQNMSTEAFKHYVQYFKQLEHKNIQRYLSAKSLFIALMNECPIATSIFHGIDNDEDIINLMIIARDYLFGTAMTTKNIDDIEFLLEFIEDMHDRLENPDVDLKFTLDDIDDLLFEEVEKRRLRRGERKREQHKRRVYKRQAHSTQHHNGSRRTRHHYRILC